MSQNNVEKWTNNQTVALIDAWKEEACLYAVKTPNYHNKAMRSDALVRVLKAVMVLRPEATITDCKSRFHNLRSEFNIEHRKVKASMKSGTGLDNVSTCSKKNIIK